MAFPYLYTNRPRKVQLATYHHPMVMYIKTEDPDLPAFYYDPLVHPIAFYKTQRKAVVPELEEDEEEEFTLPEGCTPHPSPLTHAVCMHRVSPRSERRHQLGPRGIGSHSKTAVSSRRPVSSSHGEGIVHFPCDESITLKVHASSSLRQRNPSPLLSTHLPIRRLGG